MDRHRGSFRPRSQQGAPFPFTPGDRFPGQGIDVSVLPLPPVDLVPVHRRAGGRTGTPRRRGGGWCRHLPCLLSRLAMLSREGRPGGSLPAFAWGAVAPPGATPIRAATARRSLPPPSPTRTAIGAPRGLLSLVGAIRAYHVPAPQPRGVGPLFPPAALGARDRGSSSPRTRCSRPGSIFGLSSFTTFIESSRALTVPRTLAPSPPDAGRSAVPSRCGRPSRDGGYIVRGLATARYLAAAPRRVLLTGQQARSWPTVTPDYCVASLVSH